MTHFKSDCSKDEFKLLENNNSCKIELITFDNLTDSLFLLAEIAEYCREKNVQKLQFIKRGAVVTQKFIIDDADRNYLKHISKLLSVDNLIIINNGNGDTDGWTKVAPQNKYNNTISDIVKEAHNYALSWSSLQQSTHSDA
jgi:hypothetical protein